MDLKNKTALITGSSRGIGKEIALELAKQGANIIINSSNPESAEAKSLTEEISKLGVASLFAPADVSNFDSVKEMMDKIKEKFQTIDILVNNAGITKDRTLKKMSLEEWNKVIEINLNSVFNVTNQTLSLIPEGGRIINISSIVGMGGNFGQTNYAATKAGMIGFTKSLSKELGKKQITVNCVAPGFIKTEMTDKIPIMAVDQIVEMIPMKKMGDTQDVAKTVAFLASSGSKYITGETIRIDGGLQM